MDKLATLHQQLRVASGLLDGAATLIRDVPLDPTGEHIYRIGEALAAIAEIRLAIGDVRPDLEPPYEPAPKEVSDANRRLGPVLLRAYDFVESSKLIDAIAVLEEYVMNEPSEHHRDIAKGEIERLRHGYAT
jgi:hypothetical protein